MISTIHIITHNKQSKRDNMTNEEKNLLLDLHMDYDTKNVKTSVDFSLNGVVTFTVWADTVDCRIELQKVIHSGNAVLRSIECIKTFIKERESMKSKYEVAV